MNELDRLKKLAGIKSSPIQLNEDEWDQRLHAAGDTQRMMHQDYEVDQFTNREKAARASRLAGQQERELSDMMTGAEYTQRMMHQDYELDAFDKLQGDGDTGPIHYVVPDDTSVFTDISAPEEEFFDPEAEVEIRDIKLPERLPEPAPTSLRNKQQSQPEKQNKYINAIGKSLFRDEGPDKYRSALSKFFPTVLKAIDKEDRNAMRWMYATGAPYRSNDNGDDYVQKERDWFNSLSTDEQQRLIGVAKEATGEAFKYKLQKEFDDLLGTDFFK
jgi:hypothetical protein